MGCPSASSWSDRSSPRTRSSGSATRSSGRSASTPCRSACGDLGHVVGALLANEPSASREGQYIDARPSGERAGSYRQRRQPSAERGFAAREPKEADGVTMRFDDPAAEFVLAVERVFGECPRVLDGSRAVLVGDVKLQLEAGERELWLIETHGPLEHRLAMVEVREHIDVALRKAKEELDGSL